MTPKQPAVFLSVVLIITEAQKQPLIAGTRLQLLKTLEAIAANYGSDSEPFRNRDQEFQFAVLKA